jgi:hypothetical protein
MSVYYLKVAVWNYSTCGKNHSLEDVTNWADPTEMNLIGRGLSTSSDSD